MAELLTHTAKATVSERAKLGHHVTYLSSFENILLSAAKSQVSGLSNNHLSLIDTLECKQLERVVNYLLASILPSREITDKLLSTGGKHVGLCHIFWPNRGLEM
jgi:hypothetical protein